MSIIKSAHGNFGTINNPRSVYSNMVYLADVIKENNLSTIGIFWWYLCVSSFLVRLVNSKMVYLTDAIKGKHFGKYGHFLIVSVN